MQARFRQAVDDFFASESVAVAGYSSRGDQPANFIYHKFEDLGYRVYAVNPKATKVKGTYCYESLHTVPQPVEALVICTHPDVTIEVLKNAIALGIKKVWVHRSFGPGSFSKEAQDLAEKHGITIIPTGCPMMFLKPDFFHRCMRGIMHWRGAFKI